MPAVARRSGRRTYLVVAVVAAVVVMALVWSALSTGEPYLMRVVSASVFSVNDDNTNGNTNGNGNGNTDTNLNGKGNGKTLVLVGVVPPGLRPGVSAPVDIRIANPYSFAIRVTKIEVVSPFALTPPVAGCSGTGNFATTNYTGLPFTIPKNTDFQLSRSTISSPLWPQIAMAASTTNQDRCQGAKFSLSYRATVERAHG